MFVRRSLMLVVIATLLVVKGMLPNGAAAQVVEPSLSPVAKQGKMLFNKFCAQCHGAHAAGSDKGPPLVHRIYEPNHHADGSFYLAVKRGVRPHHWRFGAMPPVPELPDDAVPFVIRYVRELQKANGIF